MQVTFQNANVHSGNESTLLHFEHGDDAARVLVDAGDGVDADDLLGPDEELAGILLTHSHIDHYRSLGRNAGPETPVYASPATATVLEQAMPEATRDNDIDGVEAALDALDPVTDWTAIRPWLEVRPVPAGHAPGAAGFLVRFDDEDVADTGLTDGRGHVLVTGDFTTRPCAGWPGLETELPVDVDAVVLNLASDDDYEATLQTALETTLERGLGGARVLVTTSALTGVQYGALLGHVAAALDRSLPVRLVGQTAKVWEALDLSAPGVEATPVFDRTDEVLDPGAVTIAGPANPRSGSAGRLLRAIEDDPAAALVQLTTGCGDAVSGRSCTTTSFDLINHPSTEQIEAVVADLAPKQVVLSHAAGRTLNDHQRRFDACFTWGANDDQRHALYEDTEWVAPGWLGDAAVRKIRTRQWERAQERPVPTGDPLPALEWGPVDPVSEGVDLDALAAQFSVGAGEAAVPDRDGAQSGPSRASGEGTDGEPPVQDATRAGENGTEAAAETSDVEDRTTAAEQRALLERLESLEDAVADASDDEGRTVPVRVLRGGDETVLQVLGDVDLPAGEVVEVQLPPADAESVPGGERSEERGATREQMDGRRSGTDDGADANGVQPDGGRQGSGSEE